MTDPLVGRLVDGRYQIVSRIARGGMATVYLAIDRRLEREVALKVMHPHLADGAQGGDFVSRFRREARAAARLTHPGLVGVYDQGVDDGTSYLTMEYVDGTNLRNRLLTEGALSVADALDTLAEILDALAAAHRSHLVHRDIKPENVLLAQDGRIKVADFGLARAVTEITSTTTGTILGTVAYLGPELILTGACDARTDVYACGILAYEMLVGAQPYTGESPIQVAYKHVNEDIPVPSTVHGWIPAELDDLVSALAARLPEHRPVDASAALDLLRRTRAMITPEDLARKAEVTPIGMPFATPCTDPECSALDGAAHEADAHDDALDEDSTHDRGAAHPQDDRDARSSDSSGLAEHGAVGAHSHSQDRDATQALGIGAAGSTIALRLGARPEHPGDEHEGTGVSLITVSSETDSSDRGAAPTRRRRKRLIIILSVLLLVIGGIAGYGAWWFNVGPGAYTNVPTGLVGNSAASSQAALTAFGLQSTQDAVFDDAVAAGDVIATKPTAGERIPKDGTVHMTVSQGIKKLVIPKGLVGLKSAKAESSLKKAGFSVAEPKLEYNNKVSAGIVTAVSEKPGASVPHDTVVTLTASQGPSPVPVPQVVNSTQASAATTLRSLGFKVKVTKVFSDDVGKGLVIAQSPAPDPSKVSYFGDTVTLTVSKGAKLVAVPDVMGMDTDAAHTALEQAGLLWEDKLSWGGFLGKVRFQSQDPGAMVAKGTVITLTVF